MEIKKDRKEYLLESDPVMDNEIRLKTQRGFTLSGDEFVEKVENKMMSPYSMVGDA